MLKKITLTIFLSTLVFFTQSAAQTESQPRMSPEKQAAVKELIGIVSADNRTEQMLEAFTRQTDVMYEEVIVSILNDRKDLTEAEKKALYEEMSARMIDFSRRVREKLLQKLNYSQMIEEITTIVYDKYYTLDEIRDLIAFYKTPTGQKTLKTMAPLTADTLKLTFERLVPKVSGVLDEIRLEQKTELEKIVDARKPRPKKAGTR